MLNNQKIKDICAQIKFKLETEHESVFPSMKSPLMLVSAQYSGFWLEHVYDVVLYAKLFPEKLSILKTTLKTFIENQTEEGQLPLGVFNRGGVFTPAYSQTQECVSFAGICLEYYKLTGDKEFLNDCFIACNKWKNWLKKYRNTLGTGLVEMFCGYDTGHDNSGRLEGMLVKGNTFGGEKVKATVCATHDPVAPIVAVDLSCNLYKTLVSLYEMANILNAPSAEFLKDANALKNALFTRCFDKEDCFFYDVDKNGNKRKYLSSTIFHLFQEGVLDISEDSEIISKIYTDYIKNPNAFWTEYPFPSMAKCDKSFKKHADYNCWGYFTQGLIGLRGTLWLDKYGFSGDYDELCKKWLIAWTNCFDNFKLGQELDPVSGEPSKSSEWYLSTMLFYYYSAKRLNII